MGDEKPFYTKSGLTTPFLRKLGELSEAGGENSQNLKGGYKSGFGINRMSFKFLS